MSQIRKFQKGGSTADNPQEETSKKATYGKLIIDGKEIEATDTLLQSLSKNGSNGGGMKGAVYTDIIDALRSGKTVNYNSSSNTISGVDFTHVDPNIINKVNENQVWDNKAQRRAKRWANSNNLKYQFTKALHDFGSSQFIQQNENENPSSESIEKLSLFGNYDKFDYNTDENGNITFSESPRNATYKKYLDAYSKLGGLTKEDAYKLYNMDENRYNQFMDWYNAYNGANYNWFGENGLWSRIQNKKYNDNDDELMKLLGWNILENSDNNSQSTSSTSVPRSYEGSRFNNDLLEKAGYYIIKGDDGNSYVGTYDSNGNFIPVQKNTYLKGTPWADNTQWENGAIYNGRLYTNDQIFNQNTDATVGITPLLNQLRSAKSPEEMDQAFRTTNWDIYGLNNNTNYYLYDSSKHSLNGFDNLFNGKSFYWNDITGNYNLEGNNKGTKILALLDPNKRNIDGTFQEKYAISRNDGTSEMFDNITALQNYLNQNNITNYEGYNPYESIKQYDYELNNGVKYIRSPYEINTGNNSFNIYKDNKGNYYTKNIKGEMVLLYGKDILEAIKNNTVTHDDLLSGYIKSKSKWWEWLWKSPTKEWYKDHMQERYEPNSYNEVFGFYKNGGKIEKKQYGGLFKTGTASYQKSEESKDKVGQASKAFGANKRDKTSADTTSNLAGFIDAAGTALAFIPGANIASAATGAAGSISRFVSDVTRDGLDGKDVGNLLLNLGLDAATLLPVLGGVARGAKVAKAAKNTTKLKNSAELIKTIAKGVHKIEKPLSVASTIGGGVTAVNALTNGDEFTSDDFSQLTQGALGLVGGIKGIKNINKNAKAAQILSGKIKNTDSIDTKDLKWYKKPGAWISNNTNKNKTAFSNWVEKEKLSYLPGTQDQIAKSFTQNKSTSDLNKELRKLATINGKFDNSLYKDLKKFVSPYRKISPEYISTILPKFITEGNFGQNTKELLSNKLYPFRVAPSEPIQTLPVIYKKDKIRLLFPDIITNSNGTIVTPWYPNVTRMLPKGNGKFFSKTQKTEGIASIYQPIKPSKYSGEVLPPRKNYRLENISKARTLNQIKNSSEGVITKILNGELKTQDDILNYITTLPKTKQQEILNTFTNKNAFKELFDKVASKQGFGYYSDAVEKLPMGLLKKGGKIVKAQPGTKLAVPFLNQDGTPMGFDQTYNYLQSKNISNTDINRIMSNLSDTFDGSYYGGGIKAAGITASKPVTKSSTPLTSTESTDLSIGSQFVDPSKTNFKFNWDDIIGLGQMLGNISANTKMYNQLEKGIKSIEGTLEQNPTEIYDRYQDHITPIYKEAATAKRNSWVPISSDPLVNYNLAQVNEDAAQRILTEGRLKESQAYSQHLDKDLQARRMYADMRRQIDQNNREKIANMLMALSQNDAAKKTSNMQSINSGIFEFRNKFAQDQQKKLSFMQQDDQMEAQRLFNSKIDELGNKWFKEFLNLSNDDKNNKYGGDWRMYWRDKDIMGYNNAIEMANNDSFNYLKLRRPNYLNYSIYRPSTTSNTIETNYYKNGGKTTKYLKRHTGPDPSDALMINRDKHTAKSLEKLHDAVIKLFMKAIS